MADRFLPAVRVDGDRRGIDAAGCPLKQFAVNAPAFFQQFGWVPGKPADCADAHPS